jgi:hypothetical protein
MFVLPRDNQDKLFVLGITLLILWIEPFILLYPLYIGCMLAIYSLFFTYISFASILYCIFGIDIINIPLTNEILQYVDFFFDYLRFYITYYKLQIISPPQV